MPMFPRFYPGSPPLTRGPPPVEFNPLCHPRITPAHAGTTLRTIIKTVDHEDHPRSRGDHLIAYAREFSDLGSPPLTRGPQQVLLVGEPDARITPAHAGTTTQ